MIPGDVIRGRKNPLWYGLSERLKRARMGRPRSELSTIAGVADGVIRRIEEESNIPGLDTIEKIARGLGVPPSWLAYGIEVQPVPAVEEGAPLACLGMGERLRDQRAERGLSRNALAKVVGLTHAGIGSIESGRTLPGVDTAEQLAQGLGVSPAWLAYGEGPQVLPKVPRRRKVVKDGPPRRAGAGQRAKIRKPPAARRGPAKRSNTRKPAK